MRSANVLEAQGGTAPGSQTSLAYARLRSAIVSGRHKAGEHLKIIDLAQALGVSPGAIREALSRLVPEHLVILLDQKGFFVAPVSMEDLEELTDLRCDIESIALRRAVARGDSAWEANIIAAAHRLSKCSRRDPETQEVSVEWSALHADFHTALVAACGSKRLLDLHARLFEQSERYRSLSLHVEVDRNVPYEHKALVDAALARDADALVELISAHLRETTASIVAAVQPKGQ